VNDPPYSSVGWNVVWPAEQRAGPAVRGQECKMVDNEAPVRRRSTVAVE